MVTITTLLTVTTVLLVRIGGHRADAGAAETCEALETGSNFVALFACLQAAGIPPSRVVLRGADLYADLNYQWLTFNGHASPAAYFLPDTADEVGVTVRCSTDSGIRIVARSGGHSYLKHSFGDETSLVIDLSRLNSVHVDTVTRTARIGAGARGGKIQHDLWAAGHASDKPPLLIPTGMCPQVGISGYALGGGLGYYARHYGTATDNILELELVTAGGGKVQTINNSTDPELFWALRGAGATSFGIVTQLTFRVHVAPKAVLIADLWYDFKDFGAVFRGWQNWLGSDPPSHLSMWALFYTDHITFQFYCMVDQDSSSEHVEAELRDLLRTYFHPLETPPLIRVQDYAAWLLEAAQPYSTTELSSPTELVNLTHLEPPRWVKVKSFFVDRLIDEAGILELEGLIAEMTPFAGALLVEQRRGAMDRLAKEETAFVHRGVYYEAQVRVHTSADDLDALRAMTKFFEGTKPVLGHTESYQNYLDEDLDDWLVRYYGQGGVDKLMEIKRRVDPGNVFHNPRSIPLPPSDSGMSTRLGSSNGLFVLVIFVAIIWAGKY